MWWTLVALACEAERPRAPLPTGRELQWAGRLWTVHASETPRGAGPNRWSDSPEAVRVDGDEAVLTLQEDASGWWSVELSTPLRRRPRRMEVMVDVGSLDSQVVAGVFLYRDDTCEVDLEVARWGDPSALPFQYAVAPADSPELVHRFDVSPGRSLHQLRWHRHSLSWRSRSRSGRERWRMTGPGVPRFDRHRLHLNLWVLHGGVPAGDGALSVRVGIIRLP